MAARIRVRMVAAAIAACALVATVAACNNSNGSNSNPCSQTLCENGSELCCAGAARGVWDPGILDCFCPEPDGGGDTVADVGADADADADVGADADADADGSSCTYPGTPHGHALGNVMDDLSFTAVNTAADDLSGGDGQLDLHDLYAHSVSCGGDLKAVLFFVSAGWCSVCAAEAPRLNALYLALKDEGILLVGVETDGPNSGVPATTAQGHAYAAHYGWTFPAVIGDVATNYWAPSDIDPTTGGVGVPLHLFIDLREMRIYGRFAGDAGDGPMRRGLEEIANSPGWDSPGVRHLDFDCAPGYGTENEPNDDTAHAVNGTTRPFTMSGVNCPMTVGDGLLLDQDLVNLGTLPAGAVINVGATRDTGAPTYPFFELIPGTTSMGYPTMGPAYMGADSVRRQWVILAAGQYFIGVIDGRNMSSFYYGSGTPPASDECCQGGADYTYNLSVDNYALDVTDGAVEVGTPAAGTLADGDLDVRTLDVTSGTTYHIRMIAADTTVLDPYLVLYDPDTSTVLGSNDDETSGSNLNSLVTYTATTTKTLWVVAGYYAAAYRGGDPAYTISVD